MSREANHFQAFLTADAADALERAGVTRRDFLKGSGALIVTFSLLEPTRALAQRSAVRELAAPGDRLDSWLAVGRDGRVTVYTGKCELGQGMATAQAQLVAEELDVPVDRITLVMCDTAVTPDQGTTSGSQSHPANFNAENLALAAATARQALVARAAARLGLPAEALAVEGGIVGARTAPSARVPYADLVGGTPFAIPLDPRARRKAPRDWRVLGTSVPRVELPALATGRFEFVHNVRVPGMLHGRVVRPPSVGAALAGVDEASVADMPGLVRVVVKKNFVGVVAEKPWQAVQAARRLVVSWTPGPALPAQHDFYDHLRGHESTRDSLIVDSADVSQALAGAARIVRATYLHPYQMHGSLGTSCAVADVRNGEATVWSATQAVHPLRSTLATVLGLAPERVRVIFRMGSGCYGLNGADAVSYDAALLSQAVGRPVRVQLMRADEAAWENFGYAYVIDQRVGLDGRGKIVAWDHEAWFTAKGSRPGYDSPGNVVTGELAGFAAAVPAPRSPAPPPDEFDNGANAAPSYVAGCVAGRCHGTGTVRHERVLVHMVPSPFFTGPLRSPSRLQNSFAHECMLDEVAAAAGADPIAYRLTHLSDQRLADVLKAVARRAGWDARSSPRPGGARTGRASGRGAACVLYEGDNGYCALVAHVDVDQDTGEVRVTRLVAGVDCGPISNPDGLRNQIEGGTLQGVSRALLEEVGWDAEKVTSTDWRTYRSLPLGFELPEVETVLIDRRDVAAMGAGETTITLAAAAMGNAIFDATGARIREVPFTPARVKAALDARA